MCVSMYGQIQNGLILEYDLYSNDIVYLRNGQVVSEPHLSQGENLYIHIKEFNPYVMKADIEVNKAHANSSLGYYSDGSQSGGSSSFSGIANLFGGLSLGSNVQDIFQGIPGSRGATQIEVAQAKQKFNTMLSTLTTVEQNINASKEKIKMVEKVESSRDLALSDIHELKTNAHIKPSRLKELIEEEIYHSFAKDKGESINIDDLIDDDELQIEFNEAVENYNTNREEYVNLSSDWNDFNSSIKLLDLINEDLQFDFIKTTTDSIAQQVEYNATSKFATPLTAKYNIDTRKSTKELAQLRRVLEEIQSDIFVYKFPPVQGKGESMNIDIKVKMDSEGLGYIDYKQLSQSIPVVGGWKITGGLGLAFGVLQDPSFNYSTLNGNIVAEENDQFIPMITSFAHVYKQSIKNFKLGGSFGVGFPITGGSGLSSASFFLGPTVVLGKTQKFLLTVGLMGSKVERLGGGLNVGDPIESLASEIPINSNYELGYFIGISYDLIK